MSDKTANNHYPPHPPATPGALTVSWAQVARAWLLDERHPEPLDLAAARLYQDLVDSLAAMLGVGGAGLIFARSVKLTSHRFPFLEEIFTLDGTEAMANQLRLTLSLQETDAAQAACIALFATFMGLLETFLGTGLAIRLLAEIRPVPETQESTG